MNPYLFIKGLLDFKKPGFVLVFSNNEFESRMRLDGIQREIRELESLFRNSIKFTFKHYKNETAELTHLLVDQFAKRDYTNYECFVCVIISRSEGGKILASDSQLELSRMISSFANNETLKKKPKIFVVQVCQDDEANDEAKSTRTNDTYQSVAQAPGDSVCFYIEGSKSVFYGTKQQRFTFIQELFEFFNTSPSLTGFNERVSTSIGKIGGSLVQEDPLVKKFQLKVNEF